MFVTCWYIEQSSAEYLLQSEEW